MKKLMFVAALAAVTSSFAANCEPVTPDPEEEPEVARIYKVQFNVYTTKGVSKEVVTDEGKEKTVCVPGEDPTKETLVLRGKDKTVIRGFAYVCSAACKMSDFAVAFCDAKRKAVFTEPTFEWDILNFIGANSQDAECAWTFKGSVAYADGKEQEYDLRGAGYGKVRKGANWFVDNLSGKFAGKASASYDLTKSCEPSNVLTCDTYEEVEYAANDTVAFGNWKMVFNANDSKEYLAGTFDIDKEIKQAMK